MVKMENPLEAWIGEIPSDWEILRLKYVFSIKKDIAGEDGHTVLSVTQQGIKPKKMDEKGQFAADYSKYQLVKKGDFVMNHMDLLTGWVDISEYDGVTSPDYRVFVLQDNEKYYADYFKYIFQLCYKHRIFYSLGQGVSGFGRWRLPADMFLNFKLPIPSRSEQEVIARFLKKHCDTIDEIIEETRKTITEYSDYRRSLISEKITKGLRENRTMKNSGYPWMGLIPTEWIVPSVSNYLDVNRGRVIPKTEVSLEYEPGLYPIYSSQTKRNGCMGYIDTYDYENEGLTWTTDGANAGTVFYREGKFNCTNVCGILTLKKNNAYLPFLNYAIGLSAYNCRRADINGYKIMSNEMAGIHFAMPVDIDEQKEIADFLEEKCKKIDAIIEEKNLLLDELNQEKVSMIYELVTGKRKVV